MLNALRRGVEELNVRCGTSQEGEESLAGSLASQQKSLKQLQQQVKQMEASAREQELEQSVRQLQGQLQALQEEKRQVAEALGAMAQQQQVLEQMQTQLLAGGKGTETGARLEELERSVSALQGQQQELKASVQDVLKMYQACPEHVGSMDKVAVAAMLQPVQQRQQQQERELQELRAQGTPGGCQEVSTVRKEVATVADALSMLCTKVEELAGTNSNDRLSCELGTVAKAVAGLTERLELLEGRSTEALPTPTNSSSTTRERPLTLERPERRSAPSPRRWLQEPLSVSVGRRSEVPGILSNNDLLSRSSHTAR
ncbi:unnamed protein product [Effrenium voratum]|nr:unnamed protein product [Effrenium voratum]